VVVLNKSVRPAAAAKSTIGVIEDNPPVWMSAIASFSRPGDWGGVGAMVEMGSQVGLGA
jgi:hypothetical protein